MGQRSTYWIHRMNQRANFLKPRPALLQPGERRASDGVRHDQGAQVTG